MTPYLRGTTLLGSKQKSGGHCPIAVGEVHRLVSKCLSVHSRTAVIFLLIPLQLGVRVRGACEAIVHAVSRLSTSLPDDCCWTLTLDFTMHSIQLLGRQCLKVWKVPPWAVRMDGIMLLWATTTLQGQ